MHFTFKLGCLQLELETSTAHKNPPLENESCALLEKPTQVMITDTMPAVRAIQGTIKLMPSVQEALFEIKHSESPSFRSRYFADGMSIYGHFIVVTADPACPVAYGIPSRYWNDADCIPLNILPLELHGTTALQHYYKDWSKEQQKKENSNADNRT